MERIGCGELTSKSSILTRKMTHKIKQNNVSKNGRTVRRPMSSNQKIFLSKSRIGKKASDIVKKHMSEAHINHPRIGYIISEETKIKLRNSVNAYYSKDPANKAKCAHIITEENRHKISLINTGNKYHLGMKNTQEMKDRMSIVKAGMPNGVTYTEELRQRMSISRINLYKNPEYKNKILISLNRLEYRKGLSERTKKRWNNPEYKKKMLDIYKNSSKVYENISQLAILNKEKWKDIEYRKMMAGKDRGSISKPEAAFALILDSMGIGYVPHHPIIETHPPYCCDFYLDKWNVVVEVDGLYWHNFPHGNPIDHIRNREMRDTGYHVIRFWEDEIKDTAHIENEMENIIRNIDCSFRVAI